MHFIKKILVFTFILSLTASCGLYKKVDQREMPDTAKAKARKNVDEGRGVGLAGIMKNRRGGNFEFSSSNPMWRATLQTLDFLPLTTVDYSGGMIITDWYSDGSNQKESIKITVRFLSNEIRSESLRIIVHKKVCSASAVCSINLIQTSKIRDELNTVILRKAALIEKQNKKKN